MRTTYTASFTRIPDGYTGHLLEWPEVFSAGKDIEQCEAQLRDALEQMMLAYHESDLAVPAGTTLFKQITVEV